MDENDLKKTCWCGFHVHSVTTVLMWLQVISSVMSLIQITVAVVMGESVSVLLPIGIVSLLTGGMVIYGMSKKKPAFYLPYLISTIITILAMLCFVIYVAINYFIEVDSQTWHITVPIYTIVFVFFVLNYYFNVTIPYRSYKLLKFESQEQRKQAAIECKNSHKSYVINMESVTPPEYNEKV